MSEYEDDFIILLRKIVALSIPNRFEATEDTYRHALMRKLEAHQMDVFLVCKAFEEALDSQKSIIDSVSNMQNSDKVSMLENVTINRDFIIKTDSLLDVCLKHHINIDYEISKLL